MNCTMCGKRLRKAICECGANHKQLLYKMADDAQIRREYEVAIEYYELIKESVETDEELRDVGRSMAKLDFSLTDLTGNDLRRENIKEKFLSNLKELSLGVVLLAILVIVYFFYKA